MTRTIATLAVSLAAATAHAQDVAVTFDEEWISLSGEVASVGATRFTLDYGENDITVELDKFEWAVDQSILPGERVIVTGKMDRNLYDNRTIEAATVFIPRLHKYVYADPMDEEGDPSVVQTFAPGMLNTTEDGDWMAITGRVTGIEGDEILVDSGSGKIRVDTSLVPGALMTPEVETGDRVLVTGGMDAAGLFDRRELEANSVVELDDRSR